MKVSLGGGLVKKSHDMSVLQKTVTIKKIEVAMYM